MTDAERIDYLQGQVLALRSMCYALAVTHKDLPQLVKAMDKYGEMQIAVTLGQATSEKTLEGAAGMRASLRAHALGMLELLQTAAKPP